MEIGLPCKRDVDDPEAYRCRKGWPAIQAQAIITADLCFRDVSVGWCGSMHDARVFSESHFYRRAEQGLVLRDKLHTVGHTPIFPYILSDAGFPLLRWCITPFTQRGATTAVHAAFNKHFSAVRTRVERAFGQWKGRFRCVLRCCNLHYTKVPDVVLATMILHNLTIKYGDAFDLRWEREAEEYEAAREARFRQEAARQAAARANSAALHLASQIAEHHDGRVVRAALMQHLQANNFMNLE